MTLLAKNVCRRALGFLFLKEMFFCLQKFATWLKSARLSPEVWGAVKWNARKTLAKQYGMLGQPPISFYWPGNFIENSVTASDRGTPTLSGWPSLCRGQLGVPNKTALSTEWKMKLSASMNLLRKQSSGRLQSMIGRGHFLHFFGTAPIFCTVTGLKFWLWILTTSKYSRNSLSRSGLCVPS